MAGNFEKVKVYDIVNAGPRRRFTVGGHLVSNCTMTGWPVERIRKEKKIRTLTKNVHFGILFAQSEDNTVNYVMAMTPLEDRANVSESMIRKGYRRYHKRYPGVRRFIEECRAAVRRDGYIGTLFGMHRPLVIPEEGDRGGQEEFEDTEKGRVTHWQNICVNTPVQGTAHQLMICALVNLERQPEKYKVLGIPQLEVHDFLGFQVLLRDLPTAYAKAKYLLEQESLNTVKSDFPHIDWRVPIITEAECGFRLGCQVPLQDGFDLGEVLLDWYKKCHEQELALDRELLESGSF